MPYYGPASSASALTVKDEGSNLDTAVTSVDFVGAGVTATNASHAVTVTIPAGTGSYASAVSSGDVTVTGSLQDMTGCSISLIAGTYIVSGVFDVLVNNALNDRTFEGHLDVGGVDQTQYALFAAPSLANDREPTVQLWKITLGSTTTVKLRGKYSGGTTGDFTVKAQSGIYAWTAGNPAFAQASLATRTAGDITTTSTTFVDATGLSVTLTTGAHRCLVLVSCVVKTSTLGANVAVDIDVDGTRLGQTFGLSLVNMGVAGQSLPINLSVLTSVLSAASHTIKVQWRVDGGTGTMYASTGVTPSMLTVIETDLAV